MPRIAIAPIHFSVTWWRTQHPGPVVVNDALPPEMLATFLLTMACTLALAAVLIAIRYRIETLSDERMHMAEEVKVITAPEPRMAP